MLLRAIIETVDKWGLKSRYLRKHKPTLQRFLESMTWSDLTSPLANKYKRRFQKSGDKMFTFLDHDGVPWNNNNAEHAIRRFAKYRRDADGRFSERTLEEYLVLASVFETCEFNNVNVLQFLLSKETTLKGLLRMAGHFRQSEGDPWDQEDGGSKVVVLNKLLPATVERLQRSIRGFECRMELAPDLWPVGIDPPQLESISMIIADYFKRRLCRKGAFVSARNLQLRWPRPSIGLKGRYVAVPFSDASTLVEPSGPKERERKPGGRWLEKADTLASEFCGAVTVRVARSNVVTTTITIYIPEYSPKLSASLNPVPARMLTSHYVTQ